MATAVLVCGANGGGFGCVGWGGGWGGAFGGADGGFLAAVAYSHRCGGGADVFARRHAGLLRYTRLLVSFRRAHASLHRADWFTAEDCIGSGYPDISWHGVKPNEPDWGEHSHSLAFMICGQHDHAIGGTGEFFYAAFNMHTEPLDFALPLLPARWHWHLLADTTKPSPDDIHEPGTEPRLDDQQKLILAAKSCVLCLGREQI